jgi:hypothetical protein
MLQKLNDIVGIILLVGVLGGGAVYGVVKFMTGPPLLRQNSQGESSYQRQARKDLERRLEDIQRQQAEIIQRNIELGRQVTGS